jgi:hypothetical protein
MGGLDQITTTMSGYHGLSLGRMTAASNKDRRVLVDDIRDGKIQEVWTYMEDQDAADNLWFSSN